ncbi:hypothetical protein D9M71_483260 [compost metagenome]
MDPVLYVAARCQHQHRQGLAAGAQARQHFEAVHARQADIEHRHGIFLTGQGQVGGHAIVQHIHGQAGTFQGLGHAFSQLQMVFDEQHTHRFLPVRVAVNGAECTADSAPVKPSQQ